MPPADLSPTDLARHTPNTRDRYVDFLRAVAIGAVVIGHLVVADVVRDADGFAGHNALATVPLLRAATLLFQVMPLFFVVGGYANTASWESARRRGEGYGTWLHGRLARLARAASAFVAVWAALVVAIAAIGATDLATTAGRLVVLPLWFLPVYTVAIAAAPVQQQIHQRWGSRALAVFAGAVVVVDLARFSAGVPLIGLANTAVVWLAFQQMGIWWRDRGAPTAQAGRRLFGAAVLALVALAGLGPYGLDMVSAPGQGVSNTAPPTVVLLVFGVAQFGLAMALRAPLSRWLERERVWAAVIAVNGRAMTLYLWHFTAIVIAALVLLPLGLAQPTAGSGEWWLLRPVWLAAELTVLAGLTVVCGRWERGWPGRVCAAPRALLAAAMLLVGFALVTTRGFWPDGHLDMASLTSIGAALVLLLTAGGRAGPTVAPSAPQAAAHR